MNRWPTCAWIIDMWINNLQNALQLLGIILNIYISNRLYVFQKRMRKICLVLK